MRANGGNLWLGLGFYCGVPGTLVALGIAWPLGLLVLVATIAAIVIGVHVEKNADVLDEIDRHVAERRNDGRRQ